MSILSLCKGKLPLIFGIVGIVGAGATTALAIHDTNKCNDRLYFAEEELGRPLTKKEKTAIVAKSYLPTICCGVGTAALMVASVAGSEAQKKTLSIVATLAETSAAATEAELIRYKNAVEETVDEETKLKIQEHKSDTAIKKAIEDHVFDNGPSADIAPSVISGELEEVYDIQTNQRFWTTRQSIEDAIIDVNVGIVSTGDPCASQKFYDLIGEDVSSSWGDSMGWKYPGRYNQNPLRVVYGSKYVEGRPVLSIDYDIFPIV